jgi:mediator of RNA polymerase II transcription subunit 18
MHELLLFASIPAPQHHDLLQQLAGLTAMQPRYRLERRLLFKAYRKPGYVNTRIGGSQDLQSSEMQRLTKMLNGGMYYTQVVGPVHERDFGSTPPPLMGPDAPGSGADEKQPENWYDFEEQPWRFEFRDIPEAGTRSAVTSRVMSNATLPRGDVILPMSAWGYRSAHP